MDQAQPDNQEARALSWETVFSYQSVGFALLRAWSLLAFTVTGLYTLHPDPSQSMRIAHTISLGAFVSSLLLAPFIFKRIPMIRKARVLVMSLITLEVGVLFLLFGTIDNKLGSILFLAGAVFTGVGSALINIGYGISWTSLASSRQALEATAASTLFAALLYPLFASAPTAFMVASVVVCPLVAVIILKATSPSTESDSLDDAPALRHLVKPTASALAFGFVVGVMRELYLGYLPEVQIPFPLFRMVAAIVVFLIVWFGLCYPRNVRLSTTNVYRFGTLGIALGIIIIPFMPSHFTLSYFFLFSGELFFTMVIWTHLSDVSRHFRVSPIYTYGFGWGSLYLGLLIGRAFLYAYSQVTNTSVFVSEFIIVAVLMVVIIITFYFGLSELSTETEESSYRKPQQFRAKCERIAQSYELTDRQSEVFRLLVQGKSVKKMQETLHLSAGTINTHIAHIYRKLDIHSKEEAMELVENYPLQ